MPKRRAVFEISRRELSLDVSVGIRIVLVAEQSSLDLQQSVQYGILNTETNLERPRVMSE